MIASQPGTSALSQYKLSAQEPAVARATFLGKVAFFRKKDTEDISKASAWLTREPADFFGAETFEVPIHKLQLEGADAVQAERQRVESAAPSAQHIYVSFPELSLRASADRPVMVKAKTDLPLNRIDVASSAANNKYAELLSICDTEAFAPPSLQLT